MDQPNEISRRNVATRILLTAAEAYPALEEAFLNARSHVTVSFTAFDLATRLRSDRAKVVGPNWADLIEQTLRRGVAINVILSDFDPILYAEAHRKSNATVRQFRALAGKISGANLTVRAMQHDSETGIWPRLLMWPWMVRQQMQAASWLNKQSPNDRASAMADMPGLVPALKQMRNGGLRFRLWQMPKLHPSVHHQELAVFDSRLLFIGGLHADSKLGGQGEEYLEKPPWHDVQLMLQGPVVAEAEAHLQSFLGAVSGTMRPTMTRKFLRTVSRKRKSNSRYFGPEPLVQDIAAAHEALIRRSQHLIYLETQYFRDHVLVQKLVQASRDNPDLTLILILPSVSGDPALGGKKTLDVRYGDYLQARALKAIGLAFGRRLFIGGAAQLSHAAVANKAAMRGRALRGSVLPHAHARVSIFDDHGAIVSSANMDKKSLRWNTEAGVLLNTPHEIADLRPRVMARWLPPGVGEEFFSLRNAAEAWRNLAVKNAGHIENNDSNQSTMILPYDLNAWHGFGSSSQIIFA